MSGERRGVSKQRQQVIVFRFKLEYTAHERFWRCLNPKTHNAESIQDRILEKLSVVLNDDNKKKLSLTMTTLLL